MKRIADLDPASYRRHAIHSQERRWAETNCYVDVIIELLHGLGHEPIAALPFSLRIDFEGDQWTFFKFPHAELAALYGWDIQELNPWRKLADHVQEQVALGRPVLVELDSFYLPDTAATAYQREHVKSTVAVNEIDVEAHHMGYFHGQGYHHLNGRDFVDIFQLDGLVHERMLPPYVETIKLSHPAIDDTAEALVEASVEYMKQHLARLPETNPFSAFRARFEADLQWLMKEPIEQFHAYSFATHRQYGACFELCETYLSWLSGHGVDGLAAATEAFGAIAAAAKAYQFQLARALARKRELPLEPLDRMAEHWAAGIRSLTERMR